MTIDPDGFIGTLLAVEGISDARVILNGPTGCRSNPAYLSDRQFNRDTSTGRLYDEPYFFGQLRMPCTFVDGDDYIHGTSQKLQEILMLMAKKDAAFLAVVNSPGASLIGDDINRFLAGAHLDGTCMAFESAAYSRPFAEGFDEAIASVLKWLRLNRLPRAKDRVNILGLSMIQKHWQGNVAELEHLCGLMGLSVVSMPGAGSSVAELRESTTASCNLVIFPEYCGKTAEFYESEFGIPSVLSPDGAPVGFSATETWVRTIASATGKDPEPALAEIRKHRIHAYHQISRRHHHRGFPKASTFAIRGDSSFVLPLTMWLHEYLGMIPVSLGFVPQEDPGAAARLREFLEERGFSGSIIGADLYAARPDLYFGDSLTGRGLMLSGSPTKAFDLFNGTGGGTDFIQKAFLGSSGALWILDHIFNSSGVFPR